MYTRGFSLVARYNASMAKAVIISAGITAVLVIISFVALDEPIARAAYKPELMFSNYVQIPTHFGESTWYLIAAAVLFVVFMLTRNRRWAHRCLFVFAAIAASGIVANAIKPLLARSRPLRMIRNDEYGFQFLEFGYDTASFPSGHACTIAAICTAMYLFFPRCRYLWLLLALGIAATRVLCVAHFASDVIAGLYLGTLTTFLLERVFVRRGIPLRHATARLLAPRTDGTSS